MMRVLMTAIPVLAGVAAWNLAPGGEVKALLVLAAAAAIGHTLSRAMRGGGKEVDLRVAGLALTIAVLLSALLPMDAPEREDVSSGSSDVVESVQYACGFWCKAGWSLGGSIAYDGIKAAIGWWEDQMDSFKRNHCAAYGDDGNHDEYCAGYMD